MLKQVLDQLPSNKILRQIARLNLIAGSESNAYRFPSHVRKVEAVILAKNVFGANAGLMRFWKLNFPTLKFHNDDVDFVITRVRADSKEEIAQAPCQLKVHGENGVLHQLECKGLKDLEILAELVKSADATPVPASEIPRIESSEARLH